MNIESLPLPDAMGAWANEGGAGDGPKVAPAPRVLIVEDDAVIAMLYAEVLDGLGFVVCAITGDESTAVADALRLKPDLMVVDQRLSNGTGVGAMNRIAETIQIPHVFVSGDPAPIHLLQPLAVVIRKPFHEADLAAAIERAFRLSTPPGSIRH